MCVFSGCDVNVSSERNGEIRSPGFKSNGGQYMKYQTCNYHVLVPAGNSMTLIREKFKLHESDWLVVRKNIDNRM